MPVGRQHLHRISPQVFHNKFRHRLVLKKWAGGVGRRSTARFVSAQLADLADFPASHGICNLRTCEDCWDIAQCFGGQLGGLA